MSYDQNPSERPSIQKDNRAPYARTHAIEIPRYQNMRRFRKNRFPNPSRGGIATIGGNQNEVAVIGEHKNNGGKTGENVGIKDHGRYYEFHETTRHDTNECTMLHRELENRMQSGN